MAAGETPRLFAFNGGILRGRVHRILTLAGIPPRMGWPGRRDAVAVWGQSPLAWRGERVAARSGAALRRIEDAFLRSVLPGRAGTPAIGLMIDRSGVHFDPSRPSDLERLLATHPLDDPALIARARDGIALLRRAHLSKYNAFDPATPAPDPGYVLVIDQTAGDASVRASDADAATFRAMLDAARADHPGARIVLRLHPETTQGHRPGHFAPADLAGCEICDAAVSPWHLLEGARAVYAVSSQLGFEAVLAGHRPVLFGQPFYAGWGLTDDRAGAPARRGRRLDPAQVFAAAYLLCPVWYDPCRDRLCSFEEAAHQITAEARAWRDDHLGWVATGMRLWKRGPLQQAFGRNRRIIFADEPGRAIASARTTARPLMVWAGKTTPELDAAGAVRVEDGLLRSRGLGAELVPPLSLVLDDLGIYYDPTRESRLERLIAAACDLTPAERMRAQALIDRILSAGLTKYNTGGALPTLPAGARGGAQDRTQGRKTESIPALSQGQPQDGPEALPAGEPHGGPHGETQGQPQDGPQDGPQAGPGRGPRLLVPGQVEDDASIRLGAGTVRTNLALLAAARAARPGARLLYKPHPDVEAGLRPGRIDTALDHADAVVERTDPAPLLDTVDEVWTMTSGLGFEALLRGVPVTCTGQPFYAGWGLTTDLGPALPRRVARPDVVALAHAVLIAYPRYTDPVSGLPCPVEVAVERLSTGAAPRRSLFNRWLAKAQGAFASLAPLWR